MENKRPIIPPKETKEYLAKHEIPQLFECLMTGLMYHRPVDPLQYLQECIEKIKRQGSQNVRWDLFLETKRSCLPPLTSKRAAEGFSKYEPLPGIDSLRLKMRPQTSVICILAGPGIDKSGFAGKMLTHYPSFVHLNMGDLAKNCARIEERKPSSRFQNAHAFIQAGDFAPEEMIFELLIWNLNQYPACNGFIVDGYPRTFEQYEDLKTHVGLERLAAVVLIDAPEEKCLQRLMNADQMNDPVDMIQSASVIRRRLCNFKNLTLPMCKAIDDDNKLRVIDGDMKDDHIAREMLTIFEFVLSGKVTGPATRPEPGTIPDAPVNRTMEKIVGCVGNPRAFDIARITPEFKDCGRRPHLPKCPVLVLLGGPGSGRTKQALALCSMIPGVKHFNITDLLRTKVLDSLVGGAQKDWDVVAKRVHSSEPPLEYDRLIPEYWDIQVDILREEFIKLANTATMVIIEGYLNDESQIITFNQNIGGADLIVLLDCEESTLNQRLSKRGARIRRVEDEGHIINQRINFFKQVTLPVVRYFDELGKLVIVPADRDADLVTKDLVYLIEYFLAKGRRQANNSAHVEVPIMKNYSNCELDKESAATRIQANFRGYICRKGMQQVDSRQKNETPNSEARNPEKNPIPTFSFSSCSLLLGLRKTPWPKDLLMNKISTLLG
ncbi:Adenylate kinase isoenzyme 5 [Sparganum proliferum]